MNHFLKGKMKGVSDRVHAFETRAGVNPFLRTLIQAARAYSADHCSVTAAALSYYSLLSIFPLMLFLVSEASNFIPADRLIRAISVFLSADLPVSTGVLAGTLRQVIQLRGAVTAASAIGFLWSAAGMFDMIQLGINRAFRTPRPRPIWRQRLVSLGMVTGVSILFGLSLLTTTGIRLAVQYRLIERHDSLLDVSTTLGTFLLGIAIFEILYRHIPYAMNLRWRDVFLGAVVSAILWEIAKSIFAWYITNYALLNLVYGSIGAVIALMLWSYITSTVMLFGAEIAAIASGARQRQAKGNEWWAFGAQTQ